MAQSTKHYREKLTKHEVGFWQSLWHDIGAWMLRTHFWKRLALGIIILVVASVGSMWGLAQWYISKHKNQEMVLGGTYIADYARYFDLDPQATYKAMIDDLGFKKVRLVSYWDNIEHDQGRYNFDELDWQMKYAEQKGVKVTLALGLRQPRWPECHMPDWAQKQGKHEWEPELLTFIQAVVMRYKDSPVLDSYQLENEFFLSVFGLCTDFDRDRLVKEFNLVKQTDPNHTVIVSMSNNAIGTPIGQPQPDQWAISVYKRVWDKTITKRYFEYPIPAWYYAFRAGFTELTRGRDAFIHELQTEPWVADPVGGIKDASIAEQDKTLDAPRLKDRIQYGKATGMREVDLWGVEWWYYRKVKLGDSSLWDTAREQLRLVDAENQTLKDQGTLFIPNSIIRK